MKFLLFLLLALFVIGVGSFFVNLGKESKKAKQNDYANKLIDHKKAELDKLNKAIKEIEDIKKQS